MNDFNLDWKVLHDSMGDFSNVYGDQKLVECMTDWLNTHMGGQWSIKKINDTHWGINYGNEVKKYD